MNGWVNRLHTAREPQRVVLRASLARLVTWPIVAALTLITAIPAGLEARQDISAAARVKAAFLYRFPGFVEWPSQALAGRASLDICVLGPTPFGTLLDELVGGETLAGRALRARLVNGRDLDACHVLFLPDDDSTARLTALQAVATRPVLTVSDADGFLEEGGVIQLRLADDRVRFEINAAAAERAGLRLSAQLLRLAIRVVGGPR